MNVLIVHAHPDPGAFIGQLRALAEDVLKKQGHAIQVSDLYAMNFNPVVTIDDFLDPLDATRFDLHAEQRHASENGTFAADIQEEQQKLMWANTILFYFPLWWYSVPGMLKGWIDRVFAYGFAYGDHYHLSGRRAMLTLTTGGPPRPYTTEKREAISHMLEHFQRGTLHFCGVEVLPPFAVYGGDYATLEQREQFLLQYRQILLSLENIRPLTFDMWR